MLVRPRRPSQSLVSAFIALLVLALPSAAGAQPALQQRVEAALAEAPAGTRFGLVVTDESGRELVAVNPDGRFVPASNTKLLTTAAAYASLGGLDSPDVGGGAEVYLSGLDLALSGRGDARMSSEPDCVSNCLATLADAVAARTRRVRNVLGLSLSFADERWSPGMSWNNMQTRSGTAVSSLSVDDNELLVVVTPSAEGRAPVLAFHPYYTIENRAVTQANGATELEFSRLPGSREVLVTGTIVVGAEPAILRLSVDDPAHYAAWRLVELLRVRGVRVTGRLETDYRDPESIVIPGGAPLIAKLVPPPLAEDIVRINKESQNFHAEMLLRRIGRARGDGSIAGGVAGVGAVMAQAGAARTGWDLSDGSGMSTYNRVSPRAMIALLRWAAGQPWGMAWRNSFPVAGVDGTLRSRFRGTALEGRLFAKTGTINAANALSGYMLGASGRVLTFAFFANDMPGGASATARMDAVLLEIAAAN